MSVGFNGTSEYLTISNLNRLNNARCWTATLSVYPSVWPSAATVGFFWSKSNVGAAPFMFEAAITDAGKVKIWFDNLSGTLGTAETTNTLGVGVASHVGIVFNGGGSTNAEKWQIYLNGGNETLTFAGAAPAVALASATDPLYMGVRSGGGNWFPGYLEEFRMWELSLSGTDILNDLTRTIPAHGEYLRLWAPLTTKTDTTVYTAYDATIAFNTASADGGTLVSRFNAISPYHTFPRPSRRWRSRRAGTQHTVPFYTGLKRGI